MLRTRNFVKPGGFHTLSSCDTPPLSLPLPHLAQGSPGQLWHLPLPSPGITTVAARYQLSTMLGSVLGHTVLPAAL